MAKRVPLHPDSLVERLMPEPGVPANFQVMVGYLGRSGTPGVWRLYDRSFSRYVDFNENDIIHARQLTPEQNPDGGTILYVTARPMVTTNDFVQGSMARFLVGRPGGGLEFCLLSDSFFFYCRE
jgi:hypothetical protein